MRSPCTVAFVLLVINVCSVSASSEGDVDLVRWNQESDTDQWVQLNASSLSQQERERFMSDGQGAFFVLGGISGPRHGNVSGKLTSSLYNQSYACDQCNFTFSLYMKADDDLEPRPNLRLYQVSNGESLTSSTRSIFQRFEMFSRDFDSTAWQKEVVNLAYSLIPFRLVFQAESDGRNSTIMAISDFKMEPKNLTTISIDVTGTTESTETQSSPISTPMVNLAINQTTPGSNPTAEITPARISSTQTTILITTAPSQNNQTQNPTSTMATMAVIALSTTRISTLLTTQSTLPTMTTTMAPPLNISYDAPLKKNSSTPASSNSTSSTPPASEQTEAQKSTQSTTRLTTLVSMSTTAINTTLSTTQSPLIIEITSPTMIRNITYAEHKNSPHEEENTGWAVPLTITVLVFIAIAVPGVIFGRHWRLRFRSRGDMQRSSLVQYEVLQL